MPDLNFKQGMKSDLPEEYFEGNIYYTLDEDTFYIDRKYDNNLERKQINANIANQLATVIVDDNITTDGVGKIYLNKDLEEAKQNSYTAITFTSDVSNNTPINAVLFTEQILTPEQKIQAKINLGLTEDVDLSNYSTTAQVNNMINSAIEAAFNNIAQAENSYF